MNSLKEINLGSSLLSLALGAGFLAFILLIVRTLIISLKSLISNFKDSDARLDTKNTQEKSKKF